MTGFLRHRGLLAVFWLLTMASVLISLTRVGKPALALFYGPQLTVSSLAMPGWTSEQRPFDRLLALNGRPVATDADIAAELGRHPVGHLHRLEVLRDGRQVAYAVPSRRVTWQDALLENLPVRIIGVFFLVIVTWVVLQAPAAPEADAFLMLGYAMAAFGFSAPDLDTTHWLWPINLACVGILANAFPCLGLSLLGERRWRTALLWLSLAVDVLILASFRPVGPVGADPRLEAVAFFLMYRWFQPWFAASLLAFVAILFRGLLRHPPGSERRQQFQVILGGALVALLPLLFVLMPALIAHRKPSAVLTNYAVLALVLFPLAIAVAVLRYRLFQVERALRHAVVHALTIGTLAALYALGLTGFASLLPSWQARSAPLQFILLISLALLLEPAVAAVQRGVDRLFDRADVDVGELSQRIQGCEALVGGPDQGLRQVLAELATGLRLSRTGLAVAAEDGWGIRLAWDAPEAVGMLLPATTFTQPFTRLDPEVAGGFVMAVRLAIGETVVAGLLLGSKRAPSPFDEADLHRLRLLGTPLAMTVGYLLAHERQHRNETVVAGLSARLAQADPTALCDGFGVIAAHELRTPLTVIQGNIELLLDGHFGMLSPPQHEVADRMHRHVGDLSRATSATLELIRLLNGQDGVVTKPTDLARLVGELTGSGTPAGQLLAQADEGRLRRILQPVLDELCQGAGGRLTVAIAADDAALAVTLQALSAQTAGRQPGAGIRGVERLLARAAVEAMGGCIDWCRSPDGRPQVVLRLPRVDGDGSG